MGNILGILDEWRDIQSVPNGNPSRKPPADQPRSRTMSNTTQTSTTRTEDETSFLVSATLHRAQGTLD